MAKLNVENLLKNESKKLEYNKKNRYKINSSLDRAKIKEELYNIKKSKVFSLMFLSFLFLGLLSWGNDYFFNSEIITSWIIGLLMVVFLFNFAKKIFDIIQKLNDKYDIQNEIEKEIKYLMFYSLFNLVFLFESPPIVILLNSVFFLFMMSAQNDSLKNLKRVGLYFKNSLKPDLTNDAYLNKLEKLFRNNILLQEQLLEYGKKLKSENREDQYYERALFDHLFYVLYNESRRTEKGYLTEYLEMTLNVNKNKVNIYN